MASAAAGRRTVVLSTDPAHSLFDVLDVPPAPGGTVVQVAQRLAAVELDASLGAGEAWGAVTAYLAELGDRVGLDPLLAEELMMLAGAGEARALARVRDAAESGDYDVVVVDCAPTAETLRLLALPDVLSCYLDRLLPAQRGLIRTLRPAAFAAAGLAPLPDAVVMAVSDWNARLEGVARFLTSPDASVRLVLTPERVVLAESRRLLTALRLHGVRVDGYVVNRLVPRVDDTDPAWVQEWARRQHDTMQEVGVSFAGLPGATSTIRQSEPVGARALADLAAATYGAALPDPRDDEPVPDPIVIAPHRDGYLMTVELAHVTIDDVRLRRRGDDLMLSVGPHRRVIALPAALRRCRVTSARLRDGRLRVQFARDDTMWPRDRLA